MPLTCRRSCRSGCRWGPSARWPRCAADFAWEETLGNSLVVREPVGVVGAITPWNYPLHQIAAKVAPALAAGCTVVLKPSEVAPLNAFVLAEIIDELGLPAGVFNLVTGRRPGRRRGASPRIPKSTWSPSPARPAPASGSPELGADDASSGSRSSSAGSPPTCILDDADLTRR